MKKFLIFLLVCMLVFSFASCSQATEMSTRDILDAAEDILEDRGKIIVDEDDYDDMQNELDDLRAAAESSAAATPDDAPVSTEKPDNTAASESTFIITPSETSPSLLLGMDEFDVYENGEVLILTSSLGSVNVFFENEQKDGQLLETKRGIYIGSTLDEVAAAYSGLPVAIFLDDIPDSPTLDEYIESYPAIYDEEEFSIMYEIGIVGDEVFSGFEFYLMLGDNEIDFGDYLSDPEPYNREYELEYIRLNISFTNNIVDSIAIMR